MGLGFFVLAFVLVFVAFATPNWLVSDYRITGAKLNRFGLWAHCFRSLGDPNQISQRRFFVGCRWIFDPFTTGYDKIRGYLVPSFMIATQFFYTICFIFVLICAVLCLLYFLCCGPEQSRFLLLVRIIAYLLLAAGLCGSLAVIIFATCANQNGWMPGHDNNFFGWSFILACIGAVACIVASILFLADAHVYDRKKRYLKESQTRFELEHETKA